MTSILKVVTDIEHEISMADQCLANILARMDEDIARITERKVQITEEFNARRRALETVIGASVGYTTHEVVEEPKRNAEDDTEIDFDAR